MTNKYARRIVWGQWDHRLGQESDGDLARQIGCDLASVRKRREKLLIPKYQEEKDEHPAWEKDLGRVNDYELAERTGVPRDRILERRRQLGIPPAKKRRKAKRERAETWTRERIALLGTMNDSDLAHHLGLCRSTVERKRSELGIDAFREPGKPISDEQIRRRTAELRIDWAPISAYGMSSGGWTLAGYEG